MRVHPERVAALVVVGAVINIAVAWGCAHYSPKSNTLERARILAFLRAKLDDRSAPLEYREFRETGFGYQIVGLPGSDPIQEMRVLTSVGWPCQSFHATAQWNTYRWEYSKWRIRLSPTRALRTGLPREHELPLLPLLPGFAINTLFYSGLVGAVWASLIALRSLRRIKRGRCPGCAYPIGVNPVCTECGCALPKRIAVAAS